MNEKHKNHIELMIMENGIIEEYRLSEDLPILGNVPNSSELVWQGSLPVHFYVTVRMYFSLFSDDIDNYFVVIHQNEYDRFVSDEPYWIEVIKGESVEKILRKFAHKCGNEESDHHPIDIYNFLENEFNLSEPLIKYSGECIPSKEREWGAPLTSSYYKKIQGGGDSKAWIYGYDNAYLFYGIIYENDKRVEKYVIHTHCNLEDLFSEVKEKESGDNFDIRSLFKNAGYDEFKEHEMLAEKKYFHEEKLIAYARIYNCSFYFYVSFLYRTVEESANLIPTDIEFAADNLAQLQALAKEYVGFLNVEEIFSKARNTVDINR